MSLFRSLNFSLLFIGRIITNLGDSLYYVISMWLVYHLTHSSFYSGIAGFLILLPETLQFMIGPIISRFSHKALLIYVQVIQSVLLLIIPILSLFGYLNIYILFICIFLSSVINQFNYPTHISLLPNIVDKRDLTKANSLMTIAYQGTDTIFNSISGLLLSFMGAMLLYIYNSFLFILVAIIFLFLKIPKTPKINSNSMTFVFYLKTLKNSISFVFSTIIIKLLYGFILLNFLTGILFAILPAYSYIEGGKAYYYGFYLTAMSIGILLGALTANYFDRFKLGKLHILLFLFSSICFLIFIYSNSIMSFIFFSLSWVTFGISNVLLLSTAQKILKSEDLSIIYTVINSLSIFSMPIGSIFSGVLSFFISPKALMFLCALLFFTVALIWFMVKDLRNLSKSDTIHL
ncbi:TPA: MFS transporter [Staphylococcus aureus]